MSYFLSRAAARSGLAAFARVHECLTVYGCAAPRTSWSGNRRERVGGNQEKSWPGSAAHFFRSLTCYTGRGSQVWQTRSKGSPPRSGEAVVFPGCGQAVFRSFTCCMSRGSAVWQTHANSKRSPPRGRPRVVGQPRVQCAPSCAWRLQASIGCAASGRRGTPVRAPRRPRLLRRRRRSESG